MDAMDEVAARAALEEQRARARREHAELIEGARQCMGSAAGRRFMRWIVEQSGLFVAAYRERASLAAYFEGRRSLGADVMRVIQQAGMAQELLPQDKNHE